MVNEIRIYIEGDARQKGKNNSISLREGFHYFFSEVIDRARDKNIQFRLVMGTSKSETFKDFIKGVNTHKDSLVLFLLDSDAELNEGESVKSFLQKQNADWNLAEFEDHQCHAMVQVMESWFLADKNTLAKFYGQNFNTNALPQNANVEKIAKSDVEAGLANATKNTQKGEYHKTRHGPKLLQLVDPQKVRDAAPHCERLFTTILDSMS